ncbi:MAG TPA: DUF222 domain-containing protein [Actinomycetes bacterium]|jgi:hypothetical protein|nr:DUF222 domain-containing protein [Actinomycetes bacterium]
MLSNDSLDARVDDRLDAEVEPDWDTVWDCPWPPDWEELLDEVRVPAAQELAAVPPGAGLAWLLEEAEAAGHPRLPDDALPVLAAAAARLGTWASSVELAATAALTGRARGWRGVDPGDQPPDHPDDQPAADRTPAGDADVDPDPPLVNLLTAREVSAWEISAALNVSLAAAELRVDLAEELRRLPRTRIALASGALDLTKARAIVAAVENLDNAAALAVEARVIARAPQQTAPNLRACLRRAVIAVDPDAAARRAEQVARDRSVGKQVLEDGSAEIVWRAPIAEIEGFWLWLTGCATAVKAADVRLAAEARAAGVSEDQWPVVRNLDQCRSDVLADLGRNGLATGLTHTGADLPRRHGRRPQIQVVVAASTLLGLDSEPAELIGAGAPTPMTAEVARRIAGQGTWRRVLVHPRTGRLDEVSADTYEPPQDMVDHVVARDQTCRGIGCRLPAARCDLDHETPYPRGATAVDNLNAECRHDHRFKTLTEASTHTEPDGTTVWTLPSGRQYRVPPRPVLDHPDLDPPDLRRIARDVRRGAGDRSEDGEGPSSDPPELDEPPF